MGGILSSAMVLVDSCSNIKKAITVLDLVKEDFPHHILCIRQLTLPYKALNTKPGLGDLLGAESRVGMVC